MSSASYFVFSRALGGWCDGPFWKLDSLGFILITFGGRFYFKFLRAGFSKTDLLQRSNP
jgi:hypothetical protein